MLGFILCSFPVFLLTEPYGSPRIESGALLTQHFAVWEPDTQKQTLLLDIQIPVDFFPK